jgi:hypothetical protein
VEGVPEKKAIFGSVIVNSKNLSCQCNLLAQIEQVQDKICLSSYYHQLPYQRKFGKFSIFILVLSVVSTRPMFEDIIFPKVRVIYVNGQSVCHGTVTM